MTDGERCNRIGQWGEVKRKLTNRERLGLGINDQGRQRGKGKERLEDEKGGERLDC